LWVGYEAFCCRDLLGFDPEYLFLDAVYQLVVWCGSRLSQRVCWQPGASAPKSGETRSAPLDNATSTLTLRISTQEDYERLGFVVGEETTTHDGMRAIPDRTIARDG